MIFLERLKFVETTFNCCEPGDLVRIAGSCNWFIYVDRVEASGCLWAVLQVAPGVLERRAFFACPTVQRCIVPEALSKLLGY